MNTVNTTPHAQQPKLNIVRPDESIAEMYESLLEHGYLVIEELASDLVQQTTSELDSHIASAPFGHDEFLGARTKRLGGVLKKSVSARDLVTHQTVLALCEQVLLSMPPTTS